MSFDKAIKSGKEHRKPYYKKAEQCDATCRPNGGCPYCKGNRFYKDKKKIENMKEQENEHNGFNEE